VENQVENLPVDQAENLPVDQADGRLLNLRVNQQRSRHLFPQCLQLSRLPSQVVHPL
jgi:hypothetical protein